MFQPQQPDQNRESTTWRSPSLGPKVEKVAYRGFATFGPRINTGTMPLRVEVEWPPVSCVFLVFFFCIFWFSLFPLPSFYFPFPLPLLLPAISPFCALVLEHSVRVTNLDRPQ